MFVVHLVMNGFEYMALENKPLDIVRNQYLLHIYVPKLTRNANKGIGMHVTDIRYINSARFRVRHGQFALKL